jgi:hypothetical protein
MSNFDELLRNNARYDKLSTGGTPDVHIPLKAEVIADWRRLADFTQYRLSPTGGGGCGLTLLS